MITAMSDPRDDELEQLEQQLETDGSSLSDEIAERYSPERLLRLVSKRAGAGARLDAATRAKYERRMGVDLSSVRVFTGEFAERVTKAHSAEAVTIGATGMILMGGTVERSPATTSGRALLAHELTHVAQAKRGLHYSAYGGATPLATEEHEAEAHAAEAEEFEIGEPEAPGDQVGPPELAAELRENLFSRVLELIEEDERVHILRNGPYPKRP